MKKIFSFLAAVMMLLTACQNDSEEQRPAEGMGRLSFEVVNYEQFSLDDETTRTSMSKLTHLDMAVYDASTNALVEHQHQAQGDNGYGTFSTTLPYGTYNIVLMGYEGSRTAIVDSPTAIHFADNFVPNFFYKTVPVTIDKPQTDAQNIALQRPIAAFTIRSQGGQNPAELASVSVSCSGGSHHFDALTGKGATVEERSYTYDMSKYAGKDTVTTVTAYTFLTAEESTMNFTVTALNKEQGIIRTREFTDVPMKVNQRTRYSGFFFAADQGSAGFTLSLEDSDWTLQDFNF